MLHQILVDRLSATATIPRAENPAALAGAFAAVREGEGRALIVVPRGAPVAAYAEAAGLPLLHARARAQEPFGTAIALLAPAVAQLAEDERREAFAGAAHLAEPLFDGAAPAGEFAIVHGLYWLTARLAARTPLALLVEDALRADEPSLRLCAYLAQRIDELPVALVLT